MDMLAYVYEYVAGLVSGVWGIVVAILTGLDVAERFLLGRPVFALTTRRKATIALAALLISQFLAFKQVSGEKVDLVDSKTALEAANRDLQGKLQRSEQAGKEDKQSAERLLREKDERISSLERESRERTSRKGTASGEDLPLKAEQRVQRATVARWLSEGNVLRAECHSLEERPHLRAKVLKWASETEQSLKSIDPGSELR